MKKSLLVKIIISVIICLIIGFLSGQTTADSIESWYRTLNKPSFNPPDWVFGPVWTTLYTIMGVSAGVIWDKGLKKSPVRRALLIFAGHLILNAVWTLLFFGLQSPQLALVEIFFLLASIIWFSVAFYRIEPWTAWIQIPYILWVSFAAILNASIVYLN